MRNNLEKFIFLLILILVAYVGSGKVGERKETGTVYESVKAGGDVAPTPFNDFLALDGGLGKNIPSLETEDAGVAVLTPDTGSKPALFNPVSNVVTPEVRGQVGLVADLSSGEVYFEKNSGKRWPMASITKLMSAAFAMRNVDLGAKICLSESDFLVVGGDLGKMLTIGECYMAKDLVKAMLMFSSNEAAEALANFYGRDDFINSLNALALDWGLLNTHFSDPTGLSAANQSTALDLRILAKNIYDAFPGIFEGTRTPRSAITEVNSGKVKNVSNINIFAGKPGFLGGKTGYTDDAQGNLLSIFEIEEKPVLVVILGTQDRFLETEKLINWFKSAYR